MGQEKIGVFAGSFDPFTVGHQEIVAAALKLFDRVIVAVGKTITKPNALFSTEERAAIIAEVFNDPRVVVKSFSGLVVEFAKREKATALVRGLRTEGDFSYEIQMAMTNKRLAGELQTIFLPTSAESQYISSTLVREVAMAGGDVSGFVPKAVQAHIKKKLK